MAHPPTHAAPDDALGALVRAELDRVLASELFKRSERLSSFLKFIVERTLSGDGDSLKEHVIAIELYGKEAAFDAAADPIVRVDARRLRDKLREYYAGAPSAVVISVPKGSYTPAFAQGTGEIQGGVPTVPHAPDQLRTAPAAHRPFRASWIAAAAIVAIGAVTFGVTRLGIGNRAEPVHLLTVTSMPGSEENPSLSPDGNFVAFSWGGAATDASPDVWVKAVEGNDLKQLTNTPDVMEMYPKWSPDGQSILFTRRVKGRPTIFKVSFLGGTEEMIAEGFTQAAWVPDGRSLVMVERPDPGRSALVHHILQTGKRRQLTEVADPFVDAHPTVSPDGRTVAFVRYGGGRSAVFLVPLAGGEPELFGQWNSGLLGGLEWLPNGRELLVGRPVTSGRRLMRESIDGSTPPVQVPGVAHGSVNPTLSRLRGDSYRLAFTSAIQDIGMRLVDLHAAQDRGQIVAHSPFCDATRMDAPGRFSRDGSMVAFVSDRGGTHEVWVANRDGSGSKSVTQLQNATVNLGSWSPDGQSLTFDATIADQTRIYIVPVNGGPARPLVESTGTQIDPEWSRDGQWIYYASTDSGRSSIWKVPAHGGTPTQLTGEIGFEPRESPDGRSIYFIDRPRNYGLGPAATLKRISIDGGVVEKVDIPAMPGAWDVTDQGIMFIFLPGLRGAEFARPPDVLQIYDFGEHRIRTVGTLGFRVGPFGSNHFLAVSPDGRWAIASHVDRWDRDVLVIDKFR